MMDIVAWVTVLMFTLGLAEYLEKTVKSSCKNEIASTLNSFPNMKLSEIIRKSNQIFIKLFNIIYVTNPGKNSFLWVWIFTSFYLIFITGLTYLFFQISVPLINILISCLIISTLVNLVYQVEHFLLKNESFLRIKKGIILILQFLIISIFVLNLIKNITLKTFMVFHDPNFIEIFELFSLMVYLNMMDFFTLTQWMLIIIVPIIIISFFIKKIKYNLYEISPIRSAFASLLGIVIVTLLNINVLQFFILDLDQIGVILLTYFFLNLFADSISLWETNIILRKAVTGSMFRFFTLLISDFLLSAFIFLSIPLSTGNFYIFRESIFFSGDCPWLGILFWSTFFTSIIFWIYILSIITLIILQNILTYYNKLEPILPIKENPIRCLGLIAMIPVSLIFLILSMIP